MTIVGDIAGVVQIAVQHVVAAGDIQHTAVGQYHVVGVNLAQAERQLSTVIHGDGIGVQSGGFFRQRCKATAVQIEAVGRNTTAVPDIQGRRRSE
jgi:hypothetical protein